MSRGGSPRVPNTSFRLTAAELGKLDRAGELLGTKTRIDTFRVMLENTLRGTPQLDDAKIARLVDEKVRELLPELFRRALLEGYAPGGSKRGG